ncbi:MAG TPA: hypothetical protein VGJ81_03600 [Thermoanaerobaculia bacterium]
MQYTIEARELTSESRQQVPASTGTRRVTLEAQDEGDAISQFVQGNESELVSFQPMRGRESIATVKKDDSVYLVRVYAG